MNSPWKRSVLGFLAPFRVGFAGLGPKVGGDAVLSMLLDETDLATAEMKVTAEHTYRTFATYESTDAVDRARKNGSITVVRVLRNAAVTRTLRITVVPFVSATDAELSVQRAVENIRIKVKSASQRHVDGVSVPGVTHVLIREILGVGPRGPAGDRLLAGQLATIYLE